MQQTFAGNGAKCVFSSGFFCAGVVQIKASPKLWTSVLVLVMCSFRGGLMGHTLARPAWPWSSCHVCGRQLVFTARCGTEGRSYYFGFGACSVHFFLYCISLRPVTGLFGPGVTSICCGSWGHPKTDFHTCHLRVFVFFRAHSAAVSPNSPHVT
jgi:hypothetical protein